MGRLETEVSEFASPRAQAFDGRACELNYEPLGCVLVAIADGKPFEQLIEDSGVADNVTAGVTNVYEIACKACGLTVPFDILETSDTKFDAETGAPLPGPAVLSKSGSRRRKEEALAELERIADAFDFTPRAVAEAYRLFGLFHEAGSSAGGRGWKTTTVAALRVASQMASNPIPVKQLCKAHSEQPPVKVVNRFLTQARQRGVIQRIPPDASQIVDVFLGRMGSVDDEINDLARTYAGRRFANITQPDQAAASIFLAAEKLERRRGKYDGVNIAKHSYVGRKQIYRTAKRMRPALGFVKENPPDVPRQMSAADIKQLRSIRKF